MTPRCPMQCHFILGPNDHLVDGGVVPVEEVQVVHIELRHGGDDSDDGEMGDAVVCKYCSVPLKIFDSYHSVILQYQYPRGCNSTILI